MSEDSSEYQPTNKITRREFLTKSIKSAAYLTLANSALYKLLNRESSSPKEKSDNPFGTYIDTGYPTVSWTRANLAVAVSKLDGQIIEPRGTFSVLDCLIPDPEKLDIENTDPKKGFVYGIGHYPPLSHIAASGICKASTDLFRAALGSPMIVVNSVTHNSVSKIHPFFKEYPYGTDSAVYIDPAYDIRHDLVIKNPWKVPVKIEYKLWDKDGNQIDPDNLLQEIDTDDYGLGVWVKTVEGIRGHGVPIPKGVVPDMIGTVPITTSIEFKPLTGNSKVLTDWNVAINNPKNLPNGQVELTRDLFIGNVHVDTYDRVSNYNV